MLKYFPSICKAPILVLSATSNNKIDAFPWYTLELTSNRANSLWSSLCSLLIYHRVLVICSQGSTLSKRSVEQALNKDKLLWPWVCRASNTSMVEKDSSHFFFFVTTVLLELSRAFYYKDFKYTCEPRIPIIISSRLINDHRLQRVWLKGHTLPIRLIKWQQRQAMVKKGPAGLHNQQYHPGHECSFAQRNPMSNHSSLLPSYRMLHNDFQSPLLGWHWLLCPGALSGSLAYFRIYTGDRMSASKG